ncbi:Ubiquitin-conjugating enzyme/RWD-like protein [Niveomyces insectorum RCEF 264]|uniref:Ubiquitin-conjugating enzyme/RWD-like protein n=1 Tax=Niveomyces insectorum RCEF 264 TaxID=1081102 RepID=A0A167Z8N9_9HYPO|nr:Ubiquitin-conjugating enzyme/RWD-like protein [Niveomyces insectorum RCEF 264]
MPIRQFLADLQALRLQIDEHGLPNIENVLAGGSNDEVIAVFVHEELSRPISVRILCGDVDSYPKMSTYFLSIDGSCVSRKYASAIARLQNTSMERTIIDMVAKIGRTFADLTTSGTANGADTHKEQAAVVVIDSSDDDGSNSAAAADDSSIEELDDDDDDDADADFADISSDYSEAVNSGIARQQRKQEEIGGYDSDTELHSARYYASMGLTSPLRKRISRDLRAVENAGFRFGVFRGMTDTSEDHLLSVSVRASKLDLPRETLLAWDIDPSVHIVLLMRLTSRYTAYENLVELSNSVAGLSFRIGQCAHPKPSLADAEAAFSAYNDSRRSSAASSSRFSNIIVSNHLNKYMSDFFLPLSKMHDEERCSWAEAVDVFFNQKPRAAQAKTAAMDGRDGEGNVAETEPSFPLVAMRFALDQLVGCTKRCQACHSELGKDFEAIRPSVCDRPLCLFQYIQMGLGLSVEHEIMSQPKVVDLLVSFCYAALAPHPTTLKPSIRKFPEGLLLMALDTDSDVKGIYTFSSDIRPSFLLADQQQAASFTVGQRVAVCTKEPTQQAEKQSTQPGQSNHSPLFTHNAQPSFSSCHHLRHATVSAVDADSATIFLDHGTFPYTYAQTEQCRLLSYTAAFDDLAPEKKPAAMGYILDTLPPIALMKYQLDAGLCTSVRSMTSVSPSAAALLEWILATNRSCIFQIDNPDLQLREYTANVHQPLQTWTQFSFLQGSPDAEVRFRKALDEALSRNLAPRRHPTIFGWHGSKIGNWHSILRTGLDATAVVNGRSYGNGVYFSHHFQTSHMYTKNIASSQEAKVQWSNSVFDLRAALSLNEIVNAPASFVSSDPHYVVWQGDWHQCRFLLVENAKPDVGQPHILDTATDSLASQDPAEILALMSSHLGADPASGLFGKTRKEAPAPQSVAEGGFLPDVSAYFVQDAQHPALGPSGQTLLIPNAAIQTKCATDQKPSSKKRKSEDAQSTEDEKNNDMSSDSEIEEVDASDMAFLLRDDDRHRFQYTTVGMQLTEATREAASAAVASAAGVTPFRPGTVDFSTLLLLPSPPWVTPAAQRALAREVAAMETLQRQTPCHELGWYIDFDKLDNLFQWIVELHSFDVTLPLAQDMAAHNITSIVFELRFGPDYPFTPPLVRVVRPRFVPFAQGGGGHVTAGGSMCMELLTSTGWSPANKLDAVLLQVRLALCNTEPQSARLVARPGGPGKASPAQNDYGISEALSGYKRAVNLHGWKLPPQMDALVNYGKKLK